MEWCRTIRSLKQRCDMKTTLIAVAVLLAFIVGRLAAPPPMTDMDKKCIDEFMRVKAEETPRTD